MKLRALVEVHGAREQLYFSDPQTKAELQALLPGLDEVGLREFVREFVRELNSRQVGVFFMFCVFAHPPFLFQWQYII